MTRTRRTIALTTGVVALTAALAGCVSAPSAVDAAEGALVWEANTAAGRLEAVAREQPSGKVLAEDLRVALVGRQFAVTPSDRRALVEEQGVPSATVYSIVSDRDRLEVSTYLQAVGTNGMGGLMATSADRFGCATLRYDYATRDIHVFDDDCPSWISNWRGGDEPSSITALMAQYPERTHEP